MSSCELCGKEFKFPYLLMRHLNKKNPCSSNKVSIENDNLNNKNNIKEHKINIQENKNIIPYYKNDNIKSIIQCEKWCHTECKKVNLY